MIYDLLHSTDNPWLRRLYAILGVFWLPIAVFLSLGLGVLGSSISVVTANVQTTWWVLRDLIDDAVDLFVDEVPRAFRNIIFTLRTGQLGAIPYA